MAKREIFQNDFLWSFSFCSNSPSLVRWINFFLINQYFLFPQPNTNQKTKYFSIKISEDDFLFRYAKVLPKWIPGTTGSAVVKKLAMDQVIFPSRFLHLLPSFIDLSFENFQVFFGPFANSLFLTYSVVTNGGGIQEVSNKFRNDFIPIMKMNYTVLFLFLSPCDIPFLLALFFFFPILLFFFCGIRCGQLEWHSISSLFLFNIKSSVLISLSLGGHRSCLTVSTKAIKICLKKSGFFRENKLCFVKK